MSTVIVSHLTVSTLIVSTVKVSSVMVLTEKVFTVIVSLVILSAVIVSTVMVSIVSNNRWFKGIQCLLKDFAGIQILYKIIDYLFAVMIRVLNNGKKSMSLTVRLHFCFVSCYEGHIFLKIEIIIINSYSFMVLCVM